MKNKLIYEETAKIIKALSHPTRLYIVDALNEEKHCVSYFTKKIGVDTSTISKHLKVLKNSGIISSEKKGNQVFYELRCPCVLSIFSCVTNVIKKDVEIRENLFKKL